MLGGNRIQIRLGIPTVYGSFTYFQFAFDYYVLNPYTRYSFINPSAASMQLLDGI